MIIAFTLFSHLAWGAGSKLKCTSAELKRRDCRLASAPYDLRLLQTTLAWNDGVWHTVDPLPLVGDDTEWKSVNFRLIGKRPILEMWIWDKGAGDTRVQSLHWYVMDAEKRKLTVLAEAVVQKRTPREGQTPLYDRAEKHELRVGKQGALEWRFGGETRAL